MRQYALRTAEGNTVKDNERKVLHIILERTEPITAVELARIVGVSERTVRSYVRSINQPAGMTCIESSRTGDWYRIDAARKRTRSAAPIW